MPIEDAGVAGNAGTDLANDVPQAIQDKFDEIFSNADNEGEPAEAVSNPAPKFTPSSPSRARQEQTDELREEGLEDADGGQPAAEAPADAEVEADAAGEPAAEPVEATPELDANLRFAAQQFNWTDTQIDKLYAADPELAEQTFNNFLSAFTSLSRQTGLVPPANQPPAQQIVNPAAQLQQQAQQSKFLSLVANVKEFSEANGEQLGGMLQALHDEVYQPLIAMRAEYMVAKQQAVAAEASTVVNSLSEKFQDFYGQGEKTNLVQQGNRSLLYQTADQLRSGAYQQGREMSVKDALNRAHLILTADRRVGEGRKQVQQQVQKRSKQITARPTQRTNPRGAGVSKGESEAMEAYSRRAQELGVDVGGIE